MKTLTDSMTAFLCSKLKCTVPIEKIYTEDCAGIFRVYHLNSFFNIFPDYDFKENAREDD